MGNLSERLSKQLSDLTDVEELKFKIEFAIFNNKLNESYKAKIEEIEKNFDAQAIFYGKKEEEYIDEKNKIVSKYNDEFQKIYDIRKEQFFNIINEIMEMQGNQKIAFANINKVVESREKFLKSAEYMEYKKQKKQFENIVNTTLNHAEFDKYSKLLEEMVDPLDEYYKKLYALTEKFDNYQAIISECEKKLVECADSANQDFEEIVKYRNSNMATLKKTNFVSNFINKVLNIFSGKAKYEKNVVLKMENELAEIAKSNDNVVKIISEQTLNLVAKIEEVREEINKSFKASME